MLQSGAFALGFAGLRRALALGATTGPGPAGPGYGPLVPDPLKMFDLPAGFGYQVISRAGDVMDDGLFVPGKHDGMAAFPDPQGPVTRCILVRNHEIEFEHATIGAFGPANELLGKVDPAKVFDKGGGKLVSRGGTTTLVFDTGGGMGKGRLEKHWLSLAGTERNCAGGPTPRNTWLSCEETLVRAGSVPSGAKPQDGRYEQDHGWCFEVPAVTTPGLVAATPIKPMGRFYREACATNPRSGVVYQTEDREDGLLYRYLPANRDRLQDGGRLQALAVVGKDSFDTRNWNEQAIKPGERVACRWFDLHDVEAPGDLTLRKQGFERGAARFARAEGMWMGAEWVYWACTNGGPRKQGQLWRYRPAPSPVEGTPLEGLNPGVLELFVQPDDYTVINNPDNITVSPWGDLIVCEDECDDDTRVAQRLLGVTLGGEVYVIGRNVLNDSELAGCTFSPDGTTLFVNIQHGPGLTLAIWGPWKRG